MRLNFEVTLKASLLDSCVLSEQCMRLLTPQVVSFQVFASKYLVLKLTILRQELLLRLFFSIFSDSLRLLISKTKTKPSTVQCPFSFEKLNILPAEELLSVFSTIWPESGKLDFRTFEKIFCHRKSNAFLPLP